jgi:glycosyltransferase involved in cell wall biosynthesis
MRTLLSLVQTAANAIRLAVLVRRYRADLVLSNSLPSHLVVSAAGLLAGRPTAWYLRDIVDAGRGRRVLGWAARPVGVLLSISQAVSATYEHPRIVEVPQPVEAPPQPPPLRPESTGGDVIVGYLGRLDPRKGVEDVCEVAGRVPARFLLAGENLLAPSAYVAGLRELAEARAPGRVTFLGAVPGPWSLLMQVDVLIVPSRREPWGRVAAEAQLMGRPVVAARTGGLPEIVHDGIDGYLYEPGDIDGLEQCLRRLVEDPALRRRLGDAGRSYAAHYDPGTTADHVAQALRPLLAPRYERTSV